jgi:DNA-binding NtrC family response regulator
MKVLLVDDDATARRLVRRFVLSVGDLEIFEASSLATARQAIAAHSPEAVLIDLCLDPTDRQNRDGLVLVREVREQSTAVPIVVTVAGEMAEIREAMRSGAYTYILKDELCEELVAPVIRGLRTRRSLEQEILGLHGLVGTSAAMQQLRRTIRRVAAADEPALILGPTGSGKELVARAIHALSPRSSMPMIAVNCSGFMESLAEAQLFGHQKGYFTGANKTRVGFFGEVGAGTLFFDEVAELALPLQGKLLRVLENRTFRMLGASEDTRFLGRVLAATHVDLPERRQHGRFRDDLYYRLDVLTVRVPTLDERKEDIPALAEHFLRAAPRQVSLSDEAKDALMKLSWGGNVRELRNLMNRLSAFADTDVVEAADVRKYKSADAERSATIRSDSMSELAAGLSLRATKKQNVIRLLQNQIRLLEAEGASAEEICGILDVGRASLFRLKAGKGEEEKG